MAKIIIPRRKVVETTLYREFISRKNSDSGYVFEYKDGEPILNNPYAKSNFRRCQEHPELYIDKGVQLREFEYIEPATAICECGKEIVLSDDYCGASECPYCGRWHNIYGQALRHPDEWEEVVGYDY